MKATILASAITLAAVAGAQAATTTVKVDLTDDAIAYSPAAVPAGKVVFEVTNQSVDKTHELVVLKIDKPDTLLPFDPKKDKVDASGHPSMGEVERLKEGKTGRLEATLAPGSYLLICNYKGHFSDGMHTVLTVQ